jgi:hypothetical protein
VPSEECRFELIHCFTGERREGDKEKKDQERKNEGEDDNEKGNVYQ